MGAVAHAVKIEPSQSNLYCAKRSARPNPPKEIMMLRFRFLLLAVSLVTAACDGESDTTSSPPDADHMIIGDTEIIRVEDVKEDAGEESEEEQIGFEIIEIQSPNLFLAWISPEITLAEFEALELPGGWLKNQPREEPECGADEVLFIKSPDGEVEGDIHIAEHFGFQWFHAASVVEMSIPVDEEGILDAVRVRKFHELVFNAGSCLVLLISPEEEVYFRVGRDLNRTSDTPTLPPSWYMQTVTVLEKLTIQLFDENLVIRSDNNDSFQGPVEELSGLR